jgi:antitoxin component YwqK of YwqJK toxin-antitoxin module
MRTSLLAALVAALLAHAAPATAGADDAPPTSICPGALESERLGPPDTDRFTSVSLPFEITASASDPPAFALRGQSVRVAASFTPDGPSVVARDADGAAVARYGFRNRLLDGPVAVFDASGHMLVEGGYRDGLRDGVWRSFCPDGRPELEGAFLSGVPDGELRVWRCDGTPVRTGRFVAGQPDGTFTLLAANGQVETATFRAGVLDGWYATAEATGRVVDGRRDGAWTRQEGERKVTETLVRGLLHGVRRTYRGDRLVGEEPYRCGRLDGLAWSESDGGAREERPWSRGASHGIASEWDASGVLRRRLRYDHGALVDVEAFYPARPWTRSRLALGAGLLAEQGGDLVFQLRAALGLSFGAAHPSRDGERARGLRWSVGVEGTENLPAGIGDATTMDREPWSNWGLFGEVGYAFDDYDPADPIPDLTLFARATPYCADLVGRCGARLSLGVSWPRHASNVLDSLLHAGDREPGTSGEGGGDGLIVMAAVLVAPVATLCHLELVTEADVDGRVRFGGLVGWGF